jgi:hypothetical protein
LTLVSAALAPNALQTSWATQREKALSYQEELARQIEEKRRRKDLEKAKEKAEGQAELEAFQRQQARWAAILMAPFCRCPSAGQKHAAPHSIEHKH